ncbi:hypothetical protein GQ53DRAFT_748159, partial [Thozetella sp. PMI_491]
MTCFQSWEIEPYHEPSYSGLSDVSSEFSEAHGVVLFAYEETIVFTSPNLQDSRHPDSQNDGYGQALSNRPALPSTEPVGFSSPPGYHSSVQYINGKPESSNYGNDYRDTKYKGYGGVYRGPDSNHSYGHGTDSGGWASRNVSVEVATSSQIHAGRDIIIDSHATVKDHRRGIFGRNRGNRYDASGSTAKSAAGAAGASGDSFVRKLQDYRLRI